MIIDVHNHIVAGEQLQTFQAGLINSAGFHRPGGVVVTEKHIQEAKWRGHKHSEVLDEVGTDFAFISPRPYTMMHSAKPEKIVHWYCQAVNDALALQVKMEPKKFRAIGGLPQNADVPVTNTFEEIDRCINDLGFVGIMINPDPGEGDGQRVLVSALRKNDEDGHSWTRARGKLQKSTRIVSRTLYYRREHCDFVAGGFESVPGFSETEADYLAWRWLGAVSSRALALAATRRSG